MAANPSRPGYRFRPKDAELLNHFLRSKINGDVEAVREIPELDDICKFEPWELPAQSPIETIDNEWFFFYPMDRKYKTGDRLKRATEEGFWKSTGPDRPIKSTDGTVIGTKKTLVFHIGRGPRGRKTYWYMHEYRSVPEQGTLLLCKLIKKADKKLDRRKDEKNIVETNVSSSAIAEDMKSEPVTPMMSAQPEKLLSTSASYLAENTDEKIPDADGENQVLNCDEVENNVYSSDNVKPFAEDMQSEPLTPMTNAQAEKIASKSASCLPQNSDVRTLEDHSYTADGAGDKINIPPDPVLEAMLGQMLDMEAEAGYHEVLEGIDEQEFEDLLKPYFCDSGTNLAVESEAPNFESYAEVGQQQFETDFEGHGQFNQNNVRAPVLVEMPVGANRTKDITTEEHFSGQHSVAVASTSNQPCDLFNSPLESGCFGNVNVNSDISATGIRVRTRQSRSLPSGRYSGLQGTAPRRIRLQMDLQDLRFEDENHGAKPVTAKAEEAEEKYSMPVGDEKETLSVSLKGISALHWFRYIPRVIVIVGFSIVFVGIWRR